MKELSLQDILENTSDLGEKIIGYVAIIGRPNAGKSTFINTLIGEKVAITSNIPQTTRHNILGIYNDDESQIIFFDTPGIHESQKLFNTQINKSAMKSMANAEIVLYFIDSSRPRGAEEEYIENLLASIDIPVFSVYSKRDLPQVQNISKGKNVFEISSMDQLGFSDLLWAIKWQLSSWQILFPQDYYTQQSVFFRVSEIIREKLFWELKQELPHSIFVSVEEIVEASDETNNVMKIIAYVYSETDSQKYIVIGKNGSLISRVWKMARCELEDIFGKKVFLQLRAKVWKNWRKDEKFIKNMLRSVSQK